MLLEWQFLAAVSPAGELVMPVCAEGVLQGTTVDVKDVKERPYCKPEEGPTPDEGCWPCAPIAATKRRIAATTTPMSVGVEGCGSKTQGKLPIFFMDRLACLVPRFVIAGTRRAFERSREPL